MKRVILFVSILFIILLMALTNPTKSEYVSWVKEHAIEQSNDNIIKGITALLGDTLIESSTKTNNLIICSIYSTEIDDNNAKVIGLLHNFVPIFSKAMILVLGIYLLVLVMVVVLILDIVIKDDEKELIS